MGYKFATEIICAYLKSSQKEGGHIQAPIFHLWGEQVDFTFGFVPLQEQVMPTENCLEYGFSGSPLQLHEIVKSTGKSNFLQARIPIKSQLNVEQWEKALVGYWDRQLLELIKVGFPLDFNHACELGQYRRHVIVDLSWPQGASVNAGIDKSSYLTSIFELTFPTVDDITSELKSLGRGALLYKVDISRVFCHVKVDPGDYDLLGLYWKGLFCVGYGTEVKFSNASAMPSDS